MSAQGVVVIDLGKNAESLGMPMDINGTAEIELHYRSYGAQYRESRYKLVISPTGMRLEKIKVSEE